jgi:hypothetical protein
MKLSYSWFSEWSNHDDLHLSWAGSVVNRPQQNRIKSGQLVEDGEQRPRIKSKLLLGDLVRF